MVSSSATKFIAPALALAAVAGILFNKSRRRRSRVADEETLLFEGTKYGAARA
jgi:hypothetical protein